MKELNIIEAMEMPIGTEFCVKNEYGEERNSKIIKATCSEVKKKLVWNDNDNPKVFVTSEIINAKFIPVQKPVGFMEAIISENRIKVVIDNWEFSDVYMKPSEMLTRLGNVCDKWRIRIIKYGKWYIEE